jgi:transcriptional regulator of acetoin/glycerol metabolism
VAAAHGAVGSAASLAELEREHILRTLRAVDGNRAAAARLLNVDRKTLYRKLKQYGDC